MNPSIGLRVFEGDSEVGSSIEDIIQYDGVGRKRSRRMGRLCPSVALAKEGRLFCEVKILVLLLWLVRNSELPQTIKDCLKRRVNFF